VNLIAGASANCVATGDEWRQEFARYIEAVPIAAAAGARILCTTHAAPTIHNHFRKDPPIELQIEIMTGTFRQAVRVAEDQGILIAFETTSTTWPVRSRVSLKRLALRLCAPISTPPIRLG